MFVYNLVIWFYSLEAFSTLIQQTFFQFSMIGNIISPVDEAKKVPNLK